MHIEYLETTGFRNLKPLRLDLSAQGSLLIGDNGQGKTNLLEALYVCATGRSFRQAKGNELVVHGGETAHLSARFVRHGVRHKIDVTIANNRFQIRVDDKYLRSMSKLLKIVNVVSFFPDDLRIVKGSPEERRRFLDRSVANHRSDFIEASQNYRKVLKSRNMLLKQGGDVAMVEVYNPQLIAYGATIHKHRKETLALLLPLARRHFIEMMNDPTLTLNLTLDEGLGDNNITPTEHLESEESFLDRFQAALVRHQQRDRATGITHAGPHRSDLMMTIAGQPARKFASQGQQRAVILALKLAEVDYLTEYLGSAPILLLDDVSSELDSQRTAKLFGRLSESPGQVWISSTGAAKLPMLPGLQNFVIEGGFARPLEESIVKDLY